MRLADTNQFPSEKILNLKILKIFEARKCNFLHFEAPN
jgi:hypothetical protein